MPFSFQSQIFRCIIKIKEDNGNVQANTSVVTVLSCLLTGCSSDNNSNQEYPSDYPTSKSYTVDEILYPEASGALVLDSDVAKVDYSNTNQGYVMAF